MREGNQSNPDNTNGAAKKGAQFKFPDANGGGAEGGKAATMDRHGAKNVMANHFRGIMRRRLTMHASIGFRRCSTLARNSRCMERKGR